jgi:hypothetical protein
MIMARWTPELDRTSRHICRSLTCQIQARPSVGRRRCMDADMLVRRTAERARRSGRPIGLTIIRTCNLFSQLIELQWRPCEGSSTSDVRGVDWSDGILTTTTMKRMGWPIKLTTAVRIVHHG